MATQLQIRRGTSTQVAAFTGAEGEIVVNTTNDSVHVNDGSTQGGFELARVDGANWAVTNSISIGGSTTVAKGSDGASILTLSGAAAGRKLDFQSFTNSGSAGAGFDLDATSGQGAITLSITGTERLKVDPTGISVTGNAGIGTSTVTDFSGSVLQIHASSGSAARIKLTTATSGTATSDGGSITFDTSNNLSLLNRESSALTFGTSALERMRIDQNGSVGIHTSSLGSLTKLTVAGRGLFTGGGIDPGDGSAAGMSIGYDTSNGFGFIQAIQTGVANKPLRIQPNGTDAVIIGAGGAKIGITGQTSPTFNLDGGFVTQTWGWHLNTSYQAGFTYTTTDRSLSIFTKSADNADYIKFSTGGSAIERGRITAAGFFGLGTTSPDRPLHIAANPGIMLLEDTGGATNFKRAQLQVDSGVFEINSRNDDNSARVDDIFTADLGTGNIGIGTSSPVQKVHASSTGITFFRATGGSGNTGIDFGQHVNNQGYLWFRDNASLLFGRNNAEVARFDTGNNFLVATTNNSPVGNNVAGIGLMANGSAQISRDGGAPLFVNRKTSNGDLIILRKDGSTVGTQGAIDGDLYVTSSASGHKGLRFGNGYIGPTNNAGTIQDNSTDLGISSHRFKDLYLSSGVYLGGTTSNNQLDDYEEGTWTPVYQGGSSNPSVSYNIQQGRYTKVGRLVVAHCRIRTSAVSSQGSGYLAVGGLPFASLNVTNIFGSGIVSYTGGNTWTDDNAPSRSYVNSNSTQAILVRYDSTDPRDEGSTSVNAASLSTGSSKNDLIITFVYAAE